MKRLMLSLIILLVSAINGFSQIELLGPTSATTGELVRVRATKLEGDDPKVICVPANNDWEALKNLDNQLVFLLSTRTPGKYTFFVSANRNGSTFVGFHTVEIVGSAPIDPDKPNPPKPPTPDSELKSILQAAYLVSPNKEALAKLINVYTEVKNSNDGAAFDNFGTAQTVLRGAVESNKLAWTDLRQVRDEVEKYLVAKCGKDAKAYNKQLLSDTLGSIISTLKSINQ